MRKFIFIVLFGMRSVGLGQEAALQFEKANQYYRSGDFKQAVQLYEEIARSGYENPMLYYNLGNGYFKLQEIPSAILNYERARRLAPHDEDILYNLRLANLRITDKIEPLPRFFLDEWWRAIVGIYSSDGWGVVLIAALWLLAATGAAFLSTGSYLIRRGVFFFFRSLPSALRLLQGRACISNSIGSRVSCTRFSSPPPSR